MAVCPTCKQQAPEGASVCPTDGTPLRDLSLLGQILGERYRVLRVIGEGGMGTVYLSEHVVLGKRFAIKVLRPELSQREDLVRRFQQEAVAASQIGQENIVDVVDFGRTPEGRLYYAMEALDGECLTDVLARERRLPLARAVPLLAQIARALGAAHERGIVHRDVKPDNVVLVQRQAGEVAKVLDFGISMVTGDLARGGERLTGAGTIIGTPEYMSPEQTVGESVDHRADVYAWGVLAYEVLTGSLPFQGKTSMDVLIAHRVKDPQPPSSRCPEAKLPAALESLVLRTLAKSRDARPQTMGEIVRELVQLAATLALPISSPTQPFGAAPAAGATPTNPAYAPTLPGSGMPPPTFTSGSNTPTLPVLPIVPAAPANRRRTRLALAVGLVAICAGAGAGFALFHRTSAPSADPEVEAVPLPSTAPTALALPPPVPAADPSVARPAAEKQTRTLHLVTTPAGASVHVDGKVLGTTPMELPVAEGAPKTVRFVLDGYRPARRLAAYRAKTSTLEVALKRKRAGRVVEEDDRADDLKADPYPEAEKP